MTQISRRTVLALGGASLLAACNGAILGNGVGSNGAAQIDARVQATKSYLFQTYPGTRDLEQKALGVLYMPLVTEAGFGFGGSYGRGALQVGGATVDYYAATRASIGLQIGAQQYAHALFFTNENSLAEFRRSAGWAASGDIRYATPEEGASIGKQTNEIDTGVQAFVFGQQGLMAGVSLAGVKYTRIIP